MRFQFSRVLPSPVRSDQVRFGPASSGPVQRSPIRPTRVQASIAQIWFAPARTGFDWVGMDWTGKDWAGWAHTRSHTVAHRLLIRGRRLSATWLKPACGSPHPRTLLLQSPNSVLSVAGHTYVSSFCQSRGSPPIHSPKEGPHAGTVPRQGAISCIRPLVQHFSAASSSAMPCFTIQPSTRLQTNGQGVHG